VELAEHVQDSLHDAWVRDLPALDLKEPDEAVRLAGAVHLRLLKQAPFVNSWPQLLALQAHPASLPGAIRRLARTCDVACSAACVGDLPSDPAYYSKRAMLGGAYGMAEVYMLTDYSEGFADTRALLERKLREGLGAEAAVRAVVSQAGAGLAAGVLRAVQAIKVKP